MKNVIVVFILVVLYASAFSQPCPDAIYLNSQAEVDNFSVYYPNCTVIEGYLGISGGDITNLNGLNVLTAIPGELRIEDCNNLTSLTGLDNVTSFEGDLEIKDNAALINLSGLDNVTSIGGGLRIQGTDALTNLTGLDNVTSIGGFLLIKVHSSLSSLTGLEGLTSVGGNLVFQVNPSLSSLTGLDNLTSIGGEYLWIGGNEALTSLTGLDNVTSVMGELMIRDNEALTSLTGLDNASFGGDLTIIHNDALSTCAVESICAYLANPNGDIEIYDNSIGCNTLYEVQDSCEANVVNINEQYIKENLIIYPNPANEELKISIERYSIDNAVIYTLTGQQVFVIKPTSNTIDISKLKAGMYIVEVTVEGMKVRTKVLVE